MRRNRLTPWIRWLGLGALLPVGALVCGCGSGVYDLPAGRPSMSDLREVCYWLDDVGIEQHFYVIELGRDSGVLEWEMVAELCEVCEEGTHNYEDRQNCVSCMMGMVQRVY